MIPSVKVIQLANSEDLQSQTGLHRMPGERKSTTEADLHPIPTFLKWAYSFVQGKLHRTCRVYRLLITGAQWKKKRYCWSTTIRLF